jgi:hypothetical protein
MMALMSGEGYTGLRLAGARRTPTDACGWQPRTAVVAIRRHPKCRRQTLSSCACNSHSERAQANHSRCRSACVFVRSGIPRLARRHTRRHAAWTLSTTAGGELGAEGVAHIHTVSYLHLDTGAVLRGQIGEAGDLTAPTTRPAHAIWSPSLMVRSGSATALTLALHGPSSRRRGAMEPSQHDTAFLFRPWAPAVDASARSSRGPSAPPPASDLRGTAATIPTRRGAPYLWRGSVKPWPSLAFIPRGRRSRERGLCLELELPDVAAAEPCACGATTCFSSLAAPRVPLRGSAEGTRRRGLGVRVDGRRGRRPRRPRRPALVDAVTAWSAAQLPLEPALRGQIGEPHCVTPDAVVTPSAVRRGYAQLGMLRSIADERLRGRRSVPSRRDCTLPSQAQRRVGGGPAGRPDAGTGHGGTR